MNSKRGEERRQRQGRVDEGRGGEEGRKKGRCRHRKEDRHRSKVAWYGTHFNDIKPENKS